VKNQVVWVVVLINLLAVAAGLGYAVMKPAETRAALTGVPVIVAGPARPPAKASKAPAKSGETAQAPAPEGEAKPAEAKPKVPPKKTDADSKPAATPPAKKGTTPPKKAVPNAVPGLTKSGSGAVDPIVEATYAGPYFERITAQPPPPELYPMRLDRRVFPDDENIEVYLAVQNASGYHWKNAFIVLKAPAQKSGESFRVDEWPIDKVAMVKYRFPKGELESRMKNLRVVSITGDQVETAMTAKLAEAREEAARKFGSGEVVVVGNMEDALADLKLKMPEGVAIPDTLDFSMAGGNAERETALQLVGKVHSAALTVHARAQALVDEVNKTGYLNSMAEGGNGAARIAELRASFRAFEEVGLELATVTAKTMDGEVRKADAPLGMLSDSLSRLRTGLKSQVGALDPKFNF